MLVARWPCLPTASSRNTTVEDCTVVGWRIRTPRREAGTVPGCLVITGRDQVANSGGVAAEASYVRTLSIGLYFFSNLPMASPCLALPCPALALTTSTCLHISGICMRVYEPAFTDRALQAACRGGRRRVVPFIKKQDSARRPWTCGETKIRARSE